MDSLHTLQAVACSTIRPTFVQCQRKESVLSLPSPCLQHWHQYPDCAIYDGNRFDTTFLSHDLRIARDIRGDTLVVKRDGPPRKFWECRWLHTKGFEDSPHNMTNCILHLCRIVKCWSQMRIMHCCNMQCCAAETWFVGHLLGLPEADWFAKSISFSDESGDYLAL